MTTYFDDLEVGDTFEAGSYTLGKDEIIAFAEQFDPQPFHVDEEAAKESMFGELVASGLHTLCIASKLAVENVFDEIANLGGRGMDSLTFSRPVKPDDTLSVEVEVVEKSDSRRRGQGYTTLETRVSNQDGDEVLSFVMYNIVERDV